MSGTGQLPELESLRTQVADLARELAERDHALQARQQDIDGELQDLRKQSDLLQAIMTGTAADTGDDFFASLATHLTSTLHMQYAVIGEILDGTPARIRTLAVSSGGHRLDNFEYDLAQAPCGTGLTESFWCFTQGVQTLFPDFPQLAAMGVESHSGVSIRNKQGKVVGLIVIMDTKPIASQDRLQTLLKVFAPRAAAELHRKHAEHELRQALHDLQNIMESVPDIMFTLDAGGNLMRWNARLVAVTGYKPDQLLNKSALAFVPVEEQPRTAEAIQRALMEGQVEFDGHLLTHTGHTIPYHWTGAALKDSAGKIIGITGIGRDVSERKQAELELTQQRQHLLESQALAHLGSYEWDLVSNEMVWSDEQSRIFGHTPQTLSVTHETFLTALLPDDHDRVLAAMNDALLGNAPYDVECRIVRPTGEVRTIHCRGTITRDPSGHPIRMAGTVLDVTDRKQIEEAMRGFQDHELRNHVDEWRSRIHPDDLDRVLQSIDAYLSKQAPEFCEEYRVQRKDGSYLWVLDRGVAIWAEDGTPLRMAGSESDITDRKRAEELLLNSVTRFDLAVQGSRDGLWYAERVSDNLFAPHNPIYYSPRMKEIMGVEDGAMPDVLGTWLSLVHPDDLPTVLSALTQHLEQRLPYDVEYRILQPGTRALRWISAKGQAVWDSAGHPIRMAGSFSDITERKQAEEALRESEARNRSILESALDAVISIDARGHIIGWNPQAEVMLGYSDQEMLGRPLDAAIIPARYRHAHAHGIRRMLQNGDASAMRRRFESFALHRDGHEFPIEFVIASPRIDGQPMFTAFVRDITERKQAEEALRESEARYRTLVELSPSGVFVFSEGQTVYVNSMAMTLLGATEPNEILARAPFEFIHPDYHEDVAKNLRRVLAGEATVHRAERVYLKMDGTPIHVHVEAVRITWNGKPAIQGFFSDITERKQAEHRLRLTQFTIDHAVDAIYWIDPQANILDVNEAACTMLGYSKEDLCTMTVHDLNPDFQADVWPDFGAETQQRGTMVFETSHRTRDGRRLPVEIQINYLSYEGQQFHCAFVRDITERKKSQEELRRSKTRLTYILESNPAVVYTRQVGNGWPFTFITPNVYELLGYTSIDVLTDPDRLDQSIHPDDDRDMMTTGMPQLLRDGAHTFVYRLRHRDGHFCWIENRARLTDDGQGTLQIVGTMLDITQRKQAEEALATSERQLRTVLDSLPIGVWFTDEKGRVLYGNPIGHRIWAKADRVGIPQPGGDGLWWERIDDTESLHRWAVGTVLARGHDVPNEMLEITTHEGDRRTIRNSAVPVKDDAGEIRGAIVLNEDITDRVRAEQALRQEHALLMAVMDAATDIIFVKDIAGRYIHMNRAGAHTLGMAVEDVIGWNEYALWPSDLAASCQLADRRVLETGEPITVEETSVSGGKATIYLTTKTPYRDPEGRIIGIIGVARDITERKRAEEALRSSEERFAKAFRSSPYPIVISELESGLFIDANDAAYEIFGYRREEVSHETGTELQLWPTADHRRRFVERLQQAGAIRNLEMDLRMQTGESRHCLVSAELIELHGKRCMVTVGSDITEQKRAEQNLQRSHAFIRQIIDTDPNFIFAKDRDGRFTLVNKAVAEAYGTTVEDLIGKTDADFNNNAEGVAFFLGKDRDVMEQRQDQFIPEERITDATGTIRWLQTVKRPILDESGRAIMVLGAATDITERKQMEEALRQRERDLRTAIDERERISQDLHDGILQSLYAVGLGLEACKPLMTQRHYKKAVATMSEAIGQLNHVMSEVRNFIAGLESQVLQGSTFPAALQQMVHTLAATHPIRCTVSVDETVADRISTQQALHLLNIVREALSNSLRHAQATKATVTLKPLSRYLRLSIVDNGIGFEPTSMRGVGHGLTNMAARARKVGGRFAIKSAPQHGTRITVDLPKETRHAESESAHGSTAARR